MTSRLNMLRTLYHLLCSVLPLIFFANTTAASEMQADILRTEIVQQTMTCLNLQSDRDRAAMEDIYHAWSPVRGLNRHNQVFTYFAITEMAQRIQRQQFEQQTATESIYNWMQWTPFNLSRRLVGKIQKSLIFNADFDRDQVLHLSIVYTLCTLAQNPRIISNWIRQSNLSEDVEHLNDVAQVLEQNGVLRVFEAVRLILLWSQWSVIFGSTEYIVDATAINESDAPVQLYVRQDTNPFLTTRTYNFQDVWEITMAERVRNLLDDNLMSSLRNHLVRAYQLPSMALHQIHRWSHQGAVGQIVQLLRCHILKQRFCNEQSWNSTVFQGNCREFVKQLLGSPSVEQMIEECKRWITWRAIERVIVVRGEQLFVAKDRHATEQQSLLKQQLLAAWSQSQMDLCLLFNTHGYVMFRYWIEFYSNISGTPLDLDTPQMLYDQQLLIDMQHDLRNPDSQQILEYAIRSNIAQLEGQHLSFLFYYSMSFVANAIHENIYLQDDITFSHGLCCSMQRFFDAIMNYSGRNIGNSCSHFFAFLVGAPRRRSSLLELTFAHMAISILSIPNLQTYQKLRMLGLPMHLIGDIECFLDQFHLDRRHRFAYAGVLSTSMLYMHLTKVGKTSIDSVMSLFDRASNSMLHREQVIQFLRLRSNWNIVSLLAFLELSVAVGRYRTNHERPPFDYAVLNIFNASDHSEASIKRIMAQLKYPAFLQRSHMNLDSCFDSNEKQRRFLEFMLVHCTIENVPVTECATAVEIPEEEQQTEHDIPSFIVSSNSLHGVARQQEEEH